MIIEKEQADIIIEGEDNSKKAKISENKLAKLQYLLTKGLYKDPITAVIAEWTNNGIDSVVQAGKNPVENPVIVTIGKNEKGIIIFSVEDKGIGLDKNDFEDICMNYLESTKEGDNDTIGHFGIGMKSFLSLDRSATFTCRKNGKERKYLVYEGKEFVNYDLIYEKDTTEENGVKAELTINNNYEQYTFEDKAKSKLAYYDTVALVINGKLIDNKIYRNDIFQWSTLAKSSVLHLTLKDVYYPIDFEALGIKPIGIPVALRLHLSDGLAPTPSRESYITNEKTKQLLLRKITELGDWLVQKYNSRVQSFKNIVEAYEYIGTIYYNVKVENQDLRINDIIPYSNLKIKEPTINNIKLQTPSFYRSKIYNIVEEWTAAGFLKSSGTISNFGNKMRNMTSYQYHIFHYKNKVVLVEDFLRGNVKTYLKEKYKGSDVLFVKRSGITRPLNATTLETSVSYENLLALKGINRLLWKDYISEYENVVNDIENSFINEKGIESKKEYIDWLEKRKEDLKAKRVKVVRSGVGLKGKEDVTLAYSYFHYSKLCFAKAVYKVSDLPDNKYVTVLITPSDDAEMGKILASVSKIATVKFATVGSNEYKKIPKIHQFKTLKEFMTDHSKPFMRIASAIKFQRLIQNYKKISNFERAPFKDLLKDINKSVVVLQKYVEENIAGHRDESFDSKIIDFADENKCYDKSCWDHYLKVETALKNYDFIPLIKDIPYYVSNEEKAKYNKLILQVLLFRKKTYKDFPEDIKIIHNGKEFLTK